MAPLTLRLAPTPTASGASSEPQSKRRSLGRARRPRNRARTRCGRATHARGTAWGQPPTSVVAVVLPGGPLYLLGHQPPAAEALPPSRRSSLGPRTQGRGARGIRAVDAGATLFLLLT